MKNSILQFASSGLWCPVRCSDGACTKQKWKERETGGLQDDELLFCGKRENKKNRKI